jgi:hypothetical protein
VTSGAWRSYDIAMIARAKARLEELAGSRFDPLDSLAHLSATLETPPLCSTNEVGG